MNKIDRNVTFCVKSGGSAVERQTINRSLDDAPVHSATSTWLHPVVETIAFIVLVNCVFTLSQVVDVDIIIYF